MDEYKHVPSYVDLGGGRTIDENRWPLLLDAVVHEWRQGHPDTPDLRPGLETRQEGDRIMVFGTDVSGAVHQLGGFDSRWLDAAVPMPEPGGRSNG